jgi:hypothetical protein
VGAGPGINPEAQVKRSPAPLEWVKIFEKNLVPPDHLSGLGGSVHFASTRYFTKQHANISKFALDSVFEFRISLDITKVAIIKP